MFAWFTEGKKVPDATFGVEHRKMVGDVRSRVGKLPREFAVMEVMGFPVRCGTVG